MKMVVAWISMNVPKILIAVNWIPNAQIPTAATCAVARIRSRVPIC